MADVHTSTRDPASPDSPAGETLDANPFPGPKPYRLNQKELFFGRRNEVEELTSLVLSTSAVLIYAHSGSGKSSLLEAGLVPNLEENFDYRIFTVRFNELGQPEDGADTPQANPFVDLVYDRVLSKDAPPSGERDIGQLAQSLCNKYGETPTLLILDQLEGMFASQALWQERSAFLIQLRRALEDNYWLRAVLAIRSDYLANFLPHERELPAPTLIRYGLKSLRERAAQAAIETAFKKTETPLPPAEMDLVLERLLRLDVGVPGHHVKGQYANLIQLQILCRRLWDEKKGKIGSPSDAGVSDGSQVLQDSQVKLADYMQSFVNEEVARVARETQSDEGIVRHWLGELITPADRREFKLVDDENDAVLPPEVLKELEEAGLIQIEQRNQLRYAELTHDSMVEAVKKSNIEWFRIHRRGRLRLTAVLAAALAVLLVLFPFLRTPTDQTLLTRTTGIVTGPSVRIPIPLAPGGHVAVVHVALSGHNDAGATVRVVADSQGKTQEKELARGAVASSNHGRVKGDVNFAIKTVPSVSYAAIVQAPHLHYDVTVRSAPVIPGAQKAGAPRTVSVDSPLFAVKLSPNQPLYLAFQFAYAQEVWATRGLLGTGSGGPLVVESPGVPGYAVVWVHNLDNQNPVQVTERSVGSGPGLYPGQQFHIRAANATIRSIPVDQIKAPFAVEALCKNYQGATLDLIDSGGRSAGSTARSVPDGSVLVPAVHGSGYRLILLSTFPEGLNCRVSARSFAQQEITTTSSRTVKIGANQRFNAYPIRLASDAAIIVTNLYGASASLDCLTGKITESDSNRLLSFVPKSHDCVLSIARSSSNLGKSVSFPLLIAPTSGR